MVGARVLVGVPTGEYARRADFYDYLNMLQLPTGSFQLFSHDRSPAHSRNLLIDAARSKNCTHILLIDDDMAFKEDALVHLLNDDKDIVSALYLNKPYPHAPLAFDLADESTGSCIPMYLDEKPGLIPIVAAGFGFILIKMSVFDKLERPYIRLGELDNEQWCDDIGFFNRVRKAGIKSFVDTRVCVGHICSLSVWPEYINGSWYTKLDTGGSGTIATPQIVIQENVTA